MKIALIAMSGVRACDQELLRLGLTLPGFVERSKVIASLPSLGLLTLAGMTPSHHEIQYLEVADLNNEDDVLAQLAGTDLVAISSFTAQMPEAYKLADHIRARDIPVVLGGLHVTCCPEEASEHCNAVVIGEGELSWPKVLEDAQKGQLKPIYDGTDASFDLADAPMPAFELLDIEKYNRLTVQTSRGCSHACEFCASSILLTKRYKQKPMEKVLAEIDRICELWEHPFIEFADDNTFVNKKYWKKLLPQLQERKIRWFTETDIKVAEDQELLRLMRDSGCAQVLIGLESPSSAGLDGLELKQNWKATLFPLYKKAIDMIQSHGISVNGCFILGLDGHGPEIFDQVYDFVEDSDLHEVQITLQTAFPGTPLYQRLDKENRIIEKEAWQKCTLFDLNFQPQNMTVDQLTRGFRNLGVRLYSDDCTRRRQKKFKAKLREVISAGKGKQRKMEEVSA
jgi:radical SAM superfamily enzyme YgiQ (UPF0313 family)